MKEIYILEFMKTLDYGRLLKAEIEDREEIDEYYLKTINQLDEIMDILNK